ncbi:MAG: ATP-binding cassette domain-containing protein [Candidatus Sabulitectum sp.]|nr:ATP-binding cassette domain-containing protein [Candidatus Sabulitectum sp.]
MLRVENLSKEFRNGRGRSAKTVHAVKDLSFQCKPGEIYGLLGPNGAGKTTTLRCLSTLIKPTSGNVVIDKYNVLEHGQIFRSKIAFLTSDMKLDGYFTPDYMMNWFGKLNKMQDDEIEQRKKKLFIDLQMTDFIHKKIDQLSTGMKQKTAVAISLIHDPEVIIFDEPTNGLDIVTSKAVTDFLVDRAQSGKIVIISTHNMTIAEKLCHRFGILVEGELREEGTLSEIIEGSNWDNLEDVFFSYIMPGGDHV